MTAKTVCLTAIFSLILSGAETLTLTVGEGAVLDYPEDVVAFSRAARKSSIRLPLPAAKSCSMRRGRVLPPPWFGLRAGSGSSAP